MAFNTYFKNPTDKGWTYFDAALPATALANSLTRTLAGSGATPALPANTLQIGSVIEWVCSGQYSVAAATTPTLDFRFALGTTAQTDLLTNSITTGSGVSNIAFEYVGRYAIISGSGTTAKGIGSARLTSSEVAIAAAVNVQAEIVADTIDLTALNQLGIALKWGAASASNTITVGLLMFKVS